MKEKLNSLKNDLIILQNKSQEINNEISKTKEEINKKFLERMILLNPIVFSMIMTSHFIFINAGSIMSLLAVVFSVGFSVSVTILILKLVDKLTGQNTLNELGVFIEKTITQGNQQNKKKLQALLILQSVITKEINKCGCTCERIIELEPLINEYVQNPHLYKKSSIGMSDLRRQNIQEIIEIDNDINNHQKIKKRRLRRFL